MKDGEPCEREDEGASDAEENERRFAGVAGESEGAVSAAVFGGGEWVVGDGDLGVLRYSGEGLEVVRVEAAMGVVVEGDAELLAQIDTERHGA